MLKIRYVDGIIIFSNGYDQYTIRITIREALTQFYKSETLYVTQTHRRLNFHELSFSQ